MKRYLKYGIFLLVLVVAADLATQIYQSRNIAKDSQEVFAQLGEKSDRFIESFFDDEGLSCDSEIFVPDFRRICTPQALETLRAQVRTNFGKRKTKGSLASDQSSYTRDIGWPAVRKVELIMRAEYEKDPDCLERVYWIQSGSDDFKIARFDIKCKNVR